MRPFIKWTDDMHKFTPALLVLALCPVAAWSAPPTAETCRTMPAKRIPADIMTNSFLDAHPDLRWRSVALGAYKKGEFTKALSDFKRAARYADKFSQSMVGHMYWNGEGTNVDRALGYAWTDLAAERGYHNFLSQRENYWSQLSDEHRADAVQRGQAIYAEYRDSVSKPRMEEVLRRALQRMTGSRTGQVGSGLYVTPREGPSAGQAIPGQIFYDKTYYQPELYWCDQDAYWSRPMNPSVEIGEPESVPAQSQDSP